MSYQIPYDFVLQYLYPVRPHVQKMLGCYGLFVNGKNILLLRETDVNPEFNGVFVATQPEFFEALSNELHHSHMEFDIDGSHHSWIFISEDLDDFQGKVQKACEMIKQGDERIGK
ncbi:hypothetical protein [Aridibaculum aurantiacum]|uniref:hypothetical protein n=1 Tax=Aridibaculum aurantiacum TaxID=2810307 RepID=UPI001A95BE76|nr:hypothetical protein [Aridibaculum aurantiacum]